jgi:hypothetical protein
LKTPFKTPFVAVASGNPTMTPRPWLRNPKNNTELLRTVFNSWNKTLASLSPSGLPGLQEELDSLFHAYGVLALCTVLLDAGAIAAFVLKPLSLIGPLVLLFGVAAGFAAAACETCAWKLSMAGPLGTNEGVHEEYFPYSSSSMRFLFGLTFLAFYCFGMFRELEENRTVGVVVPSQAEVEVDTAETHTAQTPPIPLEPLAPPSTNNDSFTLGNPGGPTPLHSPSFVPDNPGVPDKPPSIRRSLERGPSTTSPNVAGDEELKNDDVDYLGQRYVCLARLLILFRGSC